MKKNHLLTTGENIQTMETNIKAKEGTNITETSSCPRQEKMLHMAQAVQALAGWLLILGVQHIEQTWLQPLLIKFQITGLSAIIQSQQSHFACYPRNTLFTRLFHISSH